LKGWTCTGAEIATSRAIYGKVHRAPTDYRWFAWSSGFGENGPAPLEHQLALGIEDTAATLYCWRYSVNGAVAAKCYPSRAFDATGRPAIVEKQILATNSSLDIPPAVLAFFLLPETAGLDDTIWWPTWQDLRWSSLDYHLPIGERQCPVIRIEDLESRLEQGVSQLLEAVPREPLTRFYAELLAGNAPAVLNSPAPSLHPMALAALLLPLDRSTTERISLAGGIPSTRFDVQRLSHWSGVVCPPSLRPPETPSPAEEFMTKADELVRKLERSISKSRAFPREELSPGGRFLVTFLESPERWVAPGRAGAESLSVVGPWPVVKEDEEAIYLRQVVRKFIQEVHAHSSSDHQRRHLETKADLLRALLLAVCPGSDSLQAVSLPSSGCVPALLFAGRIETADWPTLAQFPEADFQRLAQQSLHCQTVPPLVREVTKWLEDCAKRSDSGRTQTYARQALASSDVSLLQP
jgi:hypothetical protein